MFTKIASCTKYTYSSTNSYGLHYHPYYELIFYTVGDGKFGISPQTLLMEKRFESSVRLLQDTSTAISDIVMLCGFATQSQFSHLFKEKYGMSPREYRKRFSID